MRLPHFAILVLHTCVKCCHVLPNSWPHNKTHALSPVAVLIRVAGNLSTVRHLHVLVSPEQRPPYFSLTVSGNYLPAKSKFSKLFHFPTAATQHVAKAIHTYLGKIHWSLHGETMTLHHNCTQASKAGKLLKGQDTKIPWENPGDPGNVGVFS